MRRLLFMIMLLFVGAFASAPVVADETGTQNPLAGIQQVSPPANGELPEIDPIALYGGDVVFDVYRKKSRVGEHRVSFARDGDRLTVTAHFHLSVKLLFFEAYAFDYQATEIWQDRALIALSAAVDDGGKLANVTAKADGGVFKIEGPRGAVLASSWIFPTNHWHRGQVNSKTILNTLTGQLAQIDVARRGIDRLETSQGPIDAERFEYTGDLRDTDVWYDRDGRWVKMTFKAKDGSRIEYRCRQCGQGAQAAALGAAVGK